MGLITSIKQNLHKRRFIFFLCLVMIMLDIAVLICPAYCVDGTTYTIYQNLSLTVTGIAFMGTLLLSFCIIYFLFAIFLSNEAKDSGWWILPTIIYFLATIGSLYMIVEIFSSGSKIYTRIEEIMRDIKFNVGENIEWYSDTYAYIYVALAITNVVTYATYQIGNTIGNKLLKINSRYHGKKLMTLKEKMLEVLVQFTLIPVSAIISLMSFTLILLPITYTLIKRVWLEKLKSHACKRYEHKYGRAVGWYTTKRKIGEQKVRDSSGNVIGSVDLYAEEKEFDDSEDIKVWVMDKSSVTYRLAFFALPLRIASFVYSILACFYKNIYVRVRSFDIDPTASWEYEYNPEIFGMLDIMYFK